MQSAFSETELQNLITGYGASFDRALIERVYSSRLLGQNPALVVHGGGNTSVKSQAREISGEQTQVLYVKGSGGDLGKIEPEGFAACRLEALTQLCALPELGDEHMVRAMKSQMLDPSGPAPSVEALLHALIPGRFVDHTHASSVLAIVDQPDSADRVRQIWKDSVLFVPYVMPGFLLARRVYELRARLDQCQLMILDKHGIFTWGESARDSYERMIAAVTDAERYLGRHLATPARPALASPTPLTRHRLLPSLRGALGRLAAQVPELESQHFVLAWRDDPSIRGLLTRPDARVIAQRGTVTPDHVIRTKAAPLWLTPSANEDDWVATATEALSEYAQRYRDYFARNAQRSLKPLTPLDPLPRVLAVGELGVVCLGRSRKEADTVGDVFAVGAEVMTLAQELGSYTPVSEQDLFDVEYWSLEQAKLKTGGLRGKLLGRIVVVSGAASGIGLESATHFASLGASVMLCDIDMPHLQHSYAPLRARYGSSVAMHCADVTSETQVTTLLDATLEQFGGLDIVISNAGNAPQGLLHTAEGDEKLRASLALNLLGHQNLASQAARVLLSQRIGGCLLFNASKSAFNPGPGFGPYAVAKAALVALVRQYAIDLGAFGIRSNAINADRVRTGLFTPQLIEERAQARNISVDDYFSNNLLSRETTAQDVAQAFAFLATAEATTGAVLTVDGGNAAAFPR